MDRVESENLLNRNSNAHFPGTLGFVSLFSGAGGLDLALHWVGLPLALAVDIKRDAALTYRKNFGVQLEEESREAKAGRYHLARVEEMEFGPSFLQKYREKVALVGGPPCQDFSLLRAPGERLGSRTQRGSLYHQFVRVRDLLRPSFFIFENVPGLISSNGGRDYAELLSLLSTGYRILFSGVVDFPTLPFLRRGNAS